ncbi:hypothetical protein FQA39_LY10532 [Lamprigera yunnana]|nr:hypothetical protein FQA39_LY10532 [Lamprigera yunnana]
MAKWYLFVFTLLPVTSSTSSTIVTPINGYTMDVDYNDRCPIKLEVILDETFSFCGKREDYENEELKTEPVIFAEPFICEEDNLTEYMNIHAVPVHQYICNECNFMTTEKDSLMGHLKIAKNVQYFCKECDFKTLLECSIKEHLRVHNRVGGRYSTKECKPPVQLSPPLPLQLETPEIVDKYICNKCGYKTRWKQLLKAHEKIHSGDKYKCNECDYKTVRKDSLKEHIKIHTGDEYKCNECDYKTPWKQLLKAHEKIHSENEFTSTY